MAKLPLYAAGITASFTILLTAAAAQDAALLKQAQEIFQPLPRDMASAEFPITRERVELGRSLFFDPRLTIDGNMSCSSCHQPAFYGTDARPKSIGVQQRPHPRNAPTVLNAGALNIIHWRGDRDSLEDQVAKAATSPITSRVQNAREASNCGRASCRSASLGVGSVGGPDHVWKQRPEYHIHRKRRWCAVDLQSAPFGCS